MPQQATPEQRKAQLLYASAKGGDAAAVKRMLSEGVLPDDGGEDGFTPLMTAAEAGHADVVGLLLEAGADVNSHNRYKQTALGYAAAPPVRVSPGHLEIVRMLLKAGVDTEAACADRGDLDTVLSGYTAAELARKGGHDDVADAIAAAAAEAQLAPLREALAPGGSSAGHFDSTIGRLLHLLKGVGLSIAETRGFGEDQDLIVVYVSPLFFFLSFFFERARRG